MTRHSYSICNNKKIIFVIIMDKFFKSSLGNNSKMFNNLYTFVLKKYFNKL